MRHVAALALALALPLTAAPARAESWCAAPLWVHEWGVHVYRAGAAPAPKPALPGHFHGPAATPSAPARTPVRALPVDTGERDLPVLHFYSSWSHGASIPVGVEVGFAAGEATAWYPAVDLRRSLAETRSPAARAAAAQRRKALGQRKPFEEQTAAAADPTAQLVWDRLELTRAPAAPPAATHTPWVTAARALDALWVNRGAESERFVFYEADTREAQPVTLRRGPRWRPERRELVLHNAGRHPVHDLLLIHREGGRTFAAFVPTIAAGAGAALVLEDHAAGADPRAATWERYRARLTDAQAPEAPAPGAAWDSGPCVMGRDPAVPVEQAMGHGLYRGEVDLLFGAWGARLFDAAGTTLVYREDEAALREAMPLAIYTDMFNVVALHRAGLALVEGLALP